MVADGLIVVDKPGGLTSHDVVARVRRLARTRRVGHGGTLDPMATGVLVVGVNKATRLLTYVVGARKSYTATVRLGAATTTDDAEGEITGTADASSVTEPAITDRLAAMVGEIDQVPSAVSAIKVNGVRAYKQVREGIAPELAARRVTIHDLRVRDIRRLDHLIDVDVDVTCSAGTYIRAIARDLGADLGVGGHLTALRRTAVGEFRLDSAVTLEELAARTPDAVVLPLREAARGCLPGRELTAEQAGKVAHGGWLPPMGLTGPYAGFAPDGALVAVLTERDGAARPATVFQTPSEG